MEELKRFIEEQRKGKEDSPVWMVGEQLLDIAQREPSSLDILKRDLEIPEMSLVEAEKKIKAWADKHKKDGFCCVSPKVAEEILREFYGLPKVDAPQKDTAAVTEVPMSDSFIDLDSLFCGE